MKVNNNMAESVGHWLRLNAAFMLRTFEILDWCDVRQLVGKGKSGHLVLSDISASLNFRQRKVSIF